MNGCNEIFTGMAIVTISLFAFVIFICAVVKFLEFVLRVKHPISITLIELLTGLSLTMGSLFVFTGIVCVLVKLIKFIG